jgi:hypothetical protein
LKPDENDIDETADTGEAASNGPQAKKRKLDEINNDVMKMLARTNIPFTFVEDPFFKRLVQDAYGVKLNGRQFFATTVLPGLSSNIISKLNKRVGSNMYAITCDGWSAKSKPSPSFYRFVFIFQY